jgi:DNA-directed RNA polymerase specialized sigma24 family protein
MSLPARRSDGLPAVPVSDGSGSLARYRARQQKAHPAAAILIDFYPAVCRLAMALCGTERAGRQVVQIVMNRSLHVLDRWGDEDDARRWFSHHTVLQCRELAPMPPPGADVLVPPGNPAGPGYAAFVRAIRQLPFQQREAFVMNHGEQLDARRLAVAMDCSMQAAGNHLAAATETLQAVAGDAYAACVANLALAYRMLGPSEELVVDDVSRYFRRRSRRRLMRVVMRIVVGVLFAAAVWGAWRMLGNRLLHP